MAASQKGGFDFRALRSSAGTRQARTGAWIMSVRPSRRPLARPPQDEEISHLPAPAETDELPMNHPLFTTPDIAIERRDDGSCILRSRQTLLPYLRVLGESLAHWAGV